MNRKNKCSEKAQAQFFSVVAFEEGQGNEEETNVCVCVYAGHEGGAADTEGGRTQGTRGSFIHGHRLNHF